MGYVLPLLALYPCMAQVREGNNLAPYVPSPQPVVIRMLETAELKPGEILYDLGCGDGRILVTAAQQFRARAVGVELSAERYKLALDTISRLGLQNAARVIHRDLMKVDISEADVVTVYLLTSSNERLKPKFEKELKPGARVVSLDYRVRGWKPKRIEKTEAHQRSYTIYLYEFPQTEQ